MEFYSGRILPPATDAIMARTPFGQIQARVAAGPDGDVAETGLGSGLNIACHPPDQGGRPGPAGTCTGSQPPRRGCCPGRVRLEFAGLDMRHLPADSGSVDLTHAAGPFCNPAIKKPLVSPNSSKRTTT